MERDKFINRIKETVGDLENSPPIYLLFGDLTNDEMNGLYNHPKIKSMVSITKGEGFGRPLLEFTLTGKPVIASNWSGHKDFLTMENSLLVGGQLNEVHESAIDTFIIKGSKWFTANYNEVAQVLNMVYDDYDSYLVKSQKLKEENRNNFSLEKMKDKFQDILKPFVVELQPKPQMTQLILPKLNKVK
jgi:glycosyltransferase involved in cell wall biosynthesis